jgi:hypothetical protein
MSLDRNNPALLGKVLRFGHPWHGLARNGVLTLPNGQQMPYRQPAGGAARVFRVPGVAGVEGPAGDDAPTPEDAAAGLQWLPYAMISGDLSGQLYTERLPADSWLYADPQGRSWLVTVSFAGSAQTVAAVEGQAATVTLRRFGLLDAAAETHVYPLAMPADMGQDTPEVYNPAITNDLVFLNKSDIQIRFFDATSDGARASFRLSVAVGTTARVTQWAWRPCGWIELAITGPGDAAAVALEVVATRAQTVGPYENITSGGDTAMWESTPTTVSVTGGDDYPTCSGTWTEHDSTEFAHGDDPGGTWRAVLLQSTGVAEGSGTSTSIRRMHHIVAVNYDAADQRRVIECSLASQVITTKRGRAGLCPGAPVRRMRARQPAQQQPAAGRHRVSPHRRKPADHGTAGQRCAGRKLRQRAVCKRAAANMAARRRHRHDADRTAGGR